MKNRIKIGISLAATTVIVALLVALIGHERIRFEDPNMDKSLIFGGLAVLFLLAKIPIRGLLAPRRRRRKTR